MSATSPHGPDQPAVSQHILGIVARRQGGRTDSRTPETFLVERARPEERLQYALRERNIELELRLREWEAAQSIYEMEFRTQEIAARVQISYVYELESQLEFSQHEHHRRLEDEAEVRAGLLAEIDRLRVEVAGLYAEVARLSGLLGAVQSRRAYRLINRVVPILRTVLYPAILARRVLRRSVKRPA
jgi:hypothetical protein